MVRIILVRHGETEWNAAGRFQGQEDTQLSRLGRQQGQQLAQALQDVPLQAVIASPLQRAAVTAGFCAAAHGLPVHTDRRLLEINHGRWEGMTAAAVQEQYKEIFLQWHRAPHTVQMPGGESLADMQVRIREAMREYCRQYERQTVLIVAHDAVNKVAVCSALGLPLQAFWQIKQDNTCINVLEYDRDCWRLVLLNSVAHRGGLFIAEEQKGL